MLKIKVNDQHEFEVAENPADFDWDIQHLKDQSYHIIKNHRNYDAEVVSVNPHDKTVVIKVNKHLYTVAVKDQLDQLLDQMGISATAGNRINEIKAPMPGLVLDIKVKVGDVLEKGTPVIVLEAMKMENILKSPGDGVVKKLPVQSGDAVEKGQVLVELE